MQVLQIQARIYVDFGFMCCDALMMEAVYLHETSVYKSTRRYNPEDQLIHSRENLSSHKGTQCYQITLWRGFALFLYINFRNHVEGKIRFIVKQLRQRVTERKLDKRLSFYV
jgi:hypothetical protein